MLVVPDQWIRRTWYPRITHMRCHGKQLRGNLSVHSLGPRHLAMIAETPAAPHPLYLIHRHGTRSTKGDAGNAENENQ